MKKESTVRELAGEILAECTMRKDEIAALPESLTATEVDEVAARSVDVILGVLARHSGEVIVNDDDLPVDPLPLHPLKLAELQGRLRFLAHPSTISWDQTVNHQVGPEKLVSHTAGIPHSWCPT